MNTPSKQDQEFTRERINRLVSDLEREVADADIPHAAELREEIATLKELLAGPGEPEGVHEKLHTIRDRLQDMTAKVEGEVLRDTPYITEIGRILGLV